MSGLQKQLIAELFFFKWWGVTTKQSLPEQKAVEFPLIGKHKNGAKIR